MPPFPFPIPISLLAEISNRSLAVIRQGCYPHVRPAWKPSGTVTHRTTQKVFPIRKNGKLYVTPEEVERLISTGWLTLKV